MKPVPAAQAVSSATPLVPAMPLVPTAAPSALVCDELLGPVLSAEAACAPLLSLEHLSIRFTTDDGELTAVNDISFSILPAGITCLVGESGCGKSLTARAVLRLLPENARASGRIVLGDKDILSLPEAAVRRIRGRQVAMIFQEPMTSLNPVLTVGEQTAEPLRLHLGLSRAEARHEAVRLFAEVGIPAPKSRYNDYPHQLSGGMRQRVMIAGALSCRPDLLLADEPTTALDATVQGQILRCIVSRSRERGMAVLLITHDLGVAARTADHIGVMYAGRLVEYGPCAAVFKNPLHPYTQGLMRSAPGVAGKDLLRLPTIPGSVPPLTRIPSGCPFHPRCSEAVPACTATVPPSYVMDGRRIACRLAAPAGQ